LRTSPEIIRLESLEKQREPERWMKQKTKPVYQNTETGGGNKP
jgi:hypothetical protein